MKIRNKKVKYIQKSEFDRILSSNIDSFKMLELFAAMCRYNCFVSVKKAGSGHLGSSFSAMDIVTYLYLKELNVVTTGTKSPDRDIYFSSKGHDVPGLYSLFYALGFIGESDILNLRRLNGLDGHPDIKHNGIEANTGSLGMGISKGKGMAWAKNYLGLGGRVFVLTGDGEFEEGQIYESLQTVAHQKITNLTVIIDRNRFQTDMLVDDVDGIEDLAAKGEAFGWFVLRCNGNDFKALKQVFDSFQYVTEQPKLLIADTVKGKGISFLENTYIAENGREMYNWHSGAPDDEHFSRGVMELESTIKQYTNDLNLQEINYTHIVLPASASSLPNKEYVTDAYGDELCELAKTHDELIVLDADLAADCRLRKFETMYPNRFIENGIAEQDMVSTAGGLAKFGLLPVVNSFGSFLSARANEQIYNNSCENYKIIYTCHFAGLLPAGPGKSHQSVRDISLFGALPNVTILQPCNKEETKMALHYCVETSQESCMLRLVIGPSPGKIKLPYDYTLEFGKGAILKKGKDAVLFAYGPVMLHEALTAADYLEKVGFELQVVNMPWLNRIDMDWLKSALELFEKVFILEDHSVVGGLGDSLIYKALQFDGNKDRTYLKFGLEEYPEYGAPKEVLEHHKLDGKSLAIRISGYDLSEESNSRMVYSNEAPQ